MCYGRSVAEKKELRIRELHVRIPTDVYAKLLARRDTLRKTQPMANLSDAVREVLEEGLKVRAR